MSKDITYKELFEWLERQRYHVSIFETEDSRMIDELEKIIGYPVDDDVIYSDIDTKEQDLYSKIYTKK